MLITHRRDIYVKILQNLKGYQSYIQYTIPIYTDKPKGNPIVQIKEHSILLTFFNTEKKEYNPFDNPCRK